AGPVLRWPRQRVGRPAQWAAWASRDDDAGWSVRPRREGARDASARSHAIAVYEPDARLSLVWPVNDEPAADRLRSSEPSKSEWLDADGHEWKSARQA